MDHLDRNGVAVGWNSQVLTWLVETMESLGSFAPMDWNHRTRIEIKAPGSKPWFCHILTGGKDLLEVAIRVPEGTFNTAQLRRELKIKTLDERSDLPIYGQWNRVRGRTLTDGWGRMAAIPPRFPGRCQDRFSQVFEGCGPCLFRQARFDRGRSS